MEVFQAFTFFIFETNVCEFTFFSAANRPNKTRDRNGPSLSKHAECLPAAEPGAVQPYIQPANEQPSDEPAKHAKQHDEENIHESNAANDSISGNAPKSIL